MHGKMGVCWSKGFDVWFLPAPPNVPLFRALWSSLDGIWGFFKGSWGVLVCFDFPECMVSGSSKPLFQVSLLLASTFFRPRGM